MLKFLYINKNKNKNYIYIYIIFWEPNGVLGLGGDTPPPLPKYVWGQSLPPPPPPKSIWGQNLPPKPHGGPWGMGPHGETPIPSPTTTTCFNKFKCYINTVFLLSVQTDKRYIRTKNVDH